MKCSNIFVKKEGRTLSSANTAYCVMDESKVMEQEKVPLYHSGRGEDLRQNLTPLYTKNITSTILKSNPILSNSQIIHSSVIGKI